MSERKKNPAVQFVVQTESVRLTNFSIRTAWKTTAALIALAARLLTSILLAIARRAHRRRFDW